VDFRDFVYSVLVFSFSVVCVVSVTKILLAFIARRAAVPPLPDDVRERISRIEQIVETTAVEVERVSEAQRFTARVLADRAGGRGLPPSHAHSPVITPH
jgi:hypothetical protein